MAARQPDHLMLSEDQIRQAKRRRYAEASAKRERLAQWLAFHVILVAVGVPLGYMIYQLTHP